ncbi:MAG: 4-hydroxy-tetrahydrodipicolinate synthase [Bacteroidaceae bacterium]|nr:4-hydroxy-tetrahydrodipicolinate synthase [Bacteroidaceae bacterium]
MNYSYPFEGLGVALVTPFKKDGQIDFERLSTIVENLIAGGVDHLCVLGTTAETPTLTESERLQVIKFVIKQNAGRIPIMVGCSSNCTASVLENIHNYELDGVDGILSAVPFYNKPSQEGIYQHFAQIAKATKKPLILYNVPGRTGVNMSAETTLRIARDFKNVIGIKEASGKMDQVKEIIAGAPEGFHVIIGDDSLAMEAIRGGAAGVISVIGNAIPKRYSELIHYTMQGRYADAEAIQKQLSPLYGLLFKEGSPCGVKALMSSRGQLENIMRLPLVPVSEALHQEIVKGFADIEG